MKYWYRLNMEDFWNLDSSIVEVVSQKSDRSEILIQTNDVAAEFLEQYDNAETFIDYSNDNGFWNMDEFSLFEFYSPGCDDPILRGEVSK